MILGLTIHFKLDLLAEFVAYPVLAIGILRREPWGSGHFAKRSMKLLGAYTLFFVAIHAPAAHGGQASETVRAYIENFGKTSPNKLAGEYWHTNGVFQAAGQVTYLDSSARIASFLEQGRANLRSNGWESSSIVEMTECPITENTFLVYTLFDRHFRDGRKVRIPVTYFVGTVEDAAKIHAITQLETGNSIRCKPGQ